MTRPILVMGLLLVAASAHADEKKDEQKPQPAPTSAPEGPSPTWRAAGIGAPLFVWSAGASASVVASDQFAGRDETGWLVTVAPRLSIERPPARFSAWLHWEPSFVMREAGEFAGADNDLDGKADGDTSVVNQGAIGIRAGGEAGPRITVEGRSTHSTEALFAEERGLTDHVETGGIASVALVAPERGHLAASGGVSKVEFSRDRSHPMFAANHTRYDATVDADARLLLRTSLGVRGFASRAEYPNPPEEFPHLDAGVTPRNAPRTVDTVGAMLVAGAQITPAMRLDLAAGAAQRSEEGMSLEPLGNTAQQEYVPYEDSTVYAPVNARLTMDVKRRARVELLAGSTVRDSHWRGNRWVQVHSAQLRAGSKVISGFDVGTHVGYAVASYPEEEYPESDGTGQATAPLARRVDATFTGGASLSYHPEGRLRLTLAYDRIQRDSGDFEQYEWQENRLSFSAFWAF